jgi:hypothetical protein
MGVSSHVGLTLHVLPGVRHSAALLRAIWVITALTAVSTMQSVIAAVDTHLGGGATETLRSNPRKLSEMWLCSVWERF